jgi:putative ABC transport system ATP-binding protein/lipoprotein-releasing system ATP-binding protein
MTRDPLVLAASLARSFGAGTTTVTAVADASFTIESADRIALVGPSGSGKSTLLHLVGGLDRPTGGEISWPALGDRVNLRPGPVGVAFQGPSLLPPLTVLENVELPMILAASPEEVARAAAVDLIDAFGLSGLEDKLPEDLSGGQSQRAAVARAFAGAPRLVLADEPTGQQDHASAERLIDAMLVIAEVDGTAIMIATHDRSIAERFETRWSMESGSLRTKELPCSA